MIKVLKWTMSLVLVSLLLYSCKKDEDSDTKKPNVVVSKEAIDFGTIEEDGTRTQSLIITSMDLSEDITVAITGDAYSISNVEGGTYGTSLTLAVADLNAGPMAVYVKCAPTGTGTFPGSIDVTSELGTIAISLTAMVKEPVLEPSVILSKSSIDFGTVTVGEEGSDNFTITSENLTEDLTVTVTGDAAFTISDAVDGTYGTSLTLAFADLNAGVVTVYAKFAPTAEGGVTGNIAVESTESGTKDVSLAGTGYVPSMLQWVENFEYSEANLPVTEKADYHSAAEAQALTDGWMRMKAIGAGELVTGLEFTGYPGSGLGKALRLEGDGNTENFARSFVTPANEPGDVLYVSCLMKVTAAAATAQQTIVFGLWQDKDPVGATFYSKLSVQNDGSGIKLGILSFKPDPNELAFAPKVLTADQTYLVILKREVSESTTYATDGKTNTKMSLFILESMPTTEPTADATQESADTKGKNADCIILQEKTIGCDVALDGLRISTTWEDLFSE